MIAVTQTINLKPVSTPAALIKKNGIFLIYMEFRWGAVAKSYMRKGFLIYEEMQKHLTINEEDVTVSLI